MSCYMNTVRVNEVRVNDVMLLDTLINRALWYLVW